ncbi:MAG: hypothetical protein ACOC6D_08265, partial [Atribacterota bacterium]
MKKILLLPAALMLITLILIGGGCGKKQPTISPREAVDIYLKSTLGTIPEADIDYDLAKQYMSAELKQEFSDPSFIPRSYCIQDGPSEVRIDSEETSNNIAEVIVSAKYGEWQEMWKFKLIIEQEEWKIDEIVCAPFSVSYTNNKYGFSFDYPETWYLAENSPEVIYASNIQEDLDQNFSDPKGIRMEVYVLDWKGTSSLEQWRKRSKLAQEPLKREEIKIDGYRALQDEYSPMNKSQGNLISVYVAGENYVIKLNYYGRKTDYYMELSNFMRTVNSFRFNVQNDNDKGKINNRETEAIPAAYHIENAPYYREDGFCWGASAIMLMIDYGLTEQEISEFRTVLKSGPGGPPDIFNGFKQFGVLNKARIAYLKDYNQQFADFYNRQLLVDPEQQVIIFNNKQEALEKLKQLVASDILVMIIGHHGNHYMI